MSLDKKYNDFKDHLKIGVVTAVYPQTSTMDIKYTSQSGNEFQMLYPGVSAGATHGSIVPPIIGSRVLILNTMGEVPIAIGTLPLNSDFLPYLDPGEIGHQSENGSYVHLKNRRKRVISTGVLIDYDATKGPNGETDIQLEPGGAIMRARSKQMQDQVYSPFDEHSHVAVFDNGDVVIQSMNANIPKGLLHFDGASGHSWWHAGDSKVQEYIELNPVKQEIVVFSDGDIHLFSQNDQKISTYTDQIVNVCGAWQFKTGVPTANIPADFDQILLDGDLNAGDIRIDNTGTPGAKLYLHISGDCNIVVDRGNVNLTVSQGNLNATASQGNINLSAPAGTLSLNASSINLTAQENLNINGLNIAINGSDAVDISAGTNASMTAGTTATISSTVSTNISSVGPLNLSGDPVNGA